MIKKINVLSDQIACNAVMLLIRLRNCSSVFVFATSIYCTAGSCSSSSSLRENSTQLISDSLRSELNKIIQTSIIPGFAVSIVKEDSVLFAEGFGYADQQTKKPFTTETVNCIASISKTFIGLSVMQLVESGKLNLDDPINSILPYKIINPYYPNIPITIRHLVTHTSTLNQEFDPEEAGGSVILLLENIEMDSSTPEDFSKSINYYKKGKPISVDEHIRNYTQPGSVWYTKENFSNLPPGKNFDYSNLNAAIAARIVEIRSGMSIEQYTKKFIFDPLEMRNTAWNYDEIDSSLLTVIYMPDDRRNVTKALIHPRYQMTDYPAGGLKTNVIDLSKYLIEVVKGYKGSGKLLSTNGYQQLLNSQLPDSSFENRSDYLFNDQYGVGIFWAISAPGYRLHNGGSIGVYSFIYFDPQTESGALAFCNLPVDDFGKVRDVVHKYREKMIK